MSAIPDSSSDFGCWYRASGWPAAARNKRLIPAAADPFSPGQHLGRLVLHAGWQLHATPKASLFASRSEVVFYVSNEPLAAGPVADAADGGLDARLGQALV